MASVVQLWDHFAEGIFVMPTARAGYKGDGVGPSVPDFSDDLRTKLRSYCPEWVKKEDSIQGDPVADFVNHVLVAADQSVAMLHWQRYESTKSEIRAEQVDLLKTLRSTSKKLQNLSPDFERLLGVDADPLGCADAIDALAQLVADADQLIAKLPTSKRQAEKDHEVALLLAIDILRVLQNFYDIPAAATADPDLGIESDAVKILKAVGGDIRLVLAAVTWRDTILAAKKLAPDLR